MKIVLCEQISACVILLYFHAATRDDIKSIIYVKMTYKCKNFYVLSVELPAVLAY